MFFHRFRKQKYAGYVFITHNVKGFDGYLLLNYLVNWGITLGVIMQGNKVLQFEDQLYGQKYINSLSFLTMRLSAISKCTGFDRQLEGLNKGSFPHCFSSEARLSYVSQLSTP